MRSNVGSKPIGISLKFSFLFSIIQFENSCAENYTGYLEDNVFSVYDQEDNYIFSTAMGVSEGDRYISENNIEYVIELVKEEKAVARKLNKIDLLEGIEMKANVVPPLAVGNNKLVAIYHTHNDESYLPGPYSIEGEGEGEIHEVALALEKALNNKGIKTIYSESMHLPHDGAAYERSRATAIDLVKKKPDAIFDLHRDAVPRKEEYLKTIKGKTISQIRIVLGRQNPNRKVNDQFARYLKAIADRQYPGLIKDIFYGHGSYNEQVSPHLLLYRIWYTCYYKRTGTGQCSDVSWSDPASIICW